MKPAACMIGTIRRTKRGLWSAWCTIHYRDPNECIHAIEAERDAAIRAKEMWKTRYKAVRDEKE